MRVEQVTPLQTQITPMHSSNVIDAVDGTTGVTGNSSMTGVAIV